MYNQNSIYCNKNFLSNILKINKNLKLKFYIQNFFFHSSKFQFNYVLEYISYITLFKKFYIYFVFLIYFFTESFLPDYIINYGTSCTLINYIIS